MSSIEVKSTGQLVDEAATLAFRISEKPDGDAQLAARMWMLVDALDRHLGDGAGVLIFDLAIVLRATWLAQEIVMSDQDDKTTAAAARQAQRLNAHRTRLVQHIDQLFGEDGITVITKTYDRGCE